MESKSDQSSQENIIHVLDIEQYLHLIEYDDEEKKRFITEPSETRLVESIHQDISENDINVATIKLIAKSAVESILQGEATDPRYALIAYHLFNYAFSKNKVHEIKVQEVMDQIISVYFLGKILVNRELQSCNNSCQRGLSYYIDKIDLLFDFTNARCDIEAGAATANGSECESDTDDEVDLEHQRVSQCKLLYFILKFKLLGCILYVNVAKKEPDVDQLFSLKKYFETCCHALESSLDELKTVVVTIKGRKLSLRDTKIVVEVSRRPTKYQISLENYVKQTTFGKANDGVNRDRSLLEVVVDNVERLKGQGSHAYTIEELDNRVNRNWISAVFLIYMFAEGSFENVDRVFGFEFSSRITTIGRTVRDDLEKFMDRVIEIKDKVDYSFSDAFVDAETLTFACRNKARQRRFRVGLKEKIEAALSRQSVESFLSPILKITTLSMLEGGYFNRIDKNHRLVLKIDLDREGTDSISALYDNYVLGYYYKSNNSVKLGWKRHDLVLQERNTSTGEINIVDTISGGDVAFATMIHELTHFVAEQVYCNKSRPYFNFSSLTEVFTLLRQKETETAALQRRLARLRRASSDNIQRLVQKIQETQQQIIEIEAALNENYSKAQMRYVERVQDNLCSAESRFNEITIELLNLYHQSKSNAVDQLEDGQQSITDRIPFEGLDDLLMCVFDNYPIEQWHSEFIARVPQIILLAPNRYKEIIPAKLLYYFEEEFMPMVNNYYKEAMVFHTNHLNTVHGSHSPDASRDRSRLSQRADYPPTPLQETGVHRGAATRFQNQVINITRR